MEKTGLPTLIGFTCAIFMTLHLCPTKTFRSLRDEKIYGLKDLSPFRVFAYDRPTIVKRGRFTNRKKWVKSSTFWENFAKKCSRKVPHEKEKSEHAAYILENLDLSDIAIFGGSIVDILLSRCPKDIDMCYLCSEKDPELRGKMLALRVRKLIEDLERLCEQQPEGDALSEEKRKIRNHDLDQEKILVTRHRSLYEIRHPSIYFPIQVVVKDNISDLFCNCEDYTSIAYFDGEIMMSERAKFSIENYASEVSIQNRPERVVKCFTKGFDLILPNLNISLLRKRNLKFNLCEVLDLPLLTIPYSSIKGNKLICRDITLSDKATQILKEDYDSKDSNYDSTEYGQYSKSNVGEIIHHNIRALAHRKFEAFIFFGEGESWDSVFQPQVPLTERAIINSYERVCNSIDANGVDLPTIERYFTVKKMSDIIDDLFVKFCSKQQSGNITNSNYSKPLKFSGEPFKQHVKNYVRELCRQQINEAKKLVDQLNQAGNLTLRVEKMKPASLNWSSEKWYGEYSSHGQQSGVDM